MVWSELLNVKAVPNQSSLEVSLVFCRYRMRAAVIDVTAASRRALVCVSCWLYYLVQGCGAVALVFYQALPVGLKYISFTSRTNRTLFYTQQACVENPLVLTTSIPSECVDVNFIQ